MRIFATVLEKLIHTILGIDQEADREIADFKPTESDYILLFRTFLIAFLVAMLAGFWFIAIVTALGTIYAAAYVIYNYLKKITQS